MYYSQTLPLLKRSFSCLLGLTVCFKKGCRFLFIYLCSILRYTTKKLIGDLDWVSNYMEEASFATSQLKKRGKGKKSYYGSLGG